MRGSLSLTRKQRELPGEREGAGSLLLGREQDRELGGEHVLPCSFVSSITLPAVLVE